METQYLDPFMDNGKDETPPEFAAVQGTEGLNCNSSENDSLMALLKEFGF